MRDGRGRGPLPGRWLGATVAAKSESKVDVGDGVKDAAIGLVLAGARWSGAAALARPFLAGSGAILMLHRVTAKNWSPLGVNAGLSIAPRFLDAVLAELSRRGQPVVAMDEMLEAMRAGRGHQVVAITADDAYLDNLTEALPVFEAHGAPFTIYVAPALVSGETLPWWEVAEELVTARDELLLPGEGGEVVLPCRDVEGKRAAARRLMRYLSSEVAEADQQAELRRLGGTAGTERRFMDWDELRRLAAHPLATLGAHTVHHVALARLAEDEALAEMLDSARIIEAETGRRPRHFAYPYGNSAAAGAREAGLARRAGFATAVTTRHGVLLPGHAAYPHALPRISVNGNFQRLADLRTLMSGLTTPLANRGRRLVTV